MLPFKRIAVTVPPEGWFHGIVAAIFRIYRQALVDLGLAVFDVPVDAFLPPDAVRIAALLAELRAFQPELALGLNKGSYALICRMPAGRDGWRPNLFTEILDIPTICFWDHAPLELADQLLTSHAPEPAASTSGALESLKRALTHPRLIQWSPDSGQTQLMQDLGLARENHVIHETPPALPGFSPRDRSAGVPQANGPRAAFIGHFYQEPVKYPHPALTSLAEDAIQTWLQPPEQPLWNVLAQRIAQMHPGARRQLALDFDQTYFWHFAHRLILHQAQTSSRLKLLGASSVPVACYGNLRTDISGVPENLIPIPDHIPFGEALAAALARHPVTIDVLNPGFIQGYSHKPILGFAAGGFVLLNRRRDFIDAFGAAGEAVSYRDGDDLRAKVDLFLRNERYRREVGDAIRETIAARFQITHVLSRVLHAVSQHLEASLRDQKPATPPDSARQVTTVFNLLPGIRSEPHWKGSAVRHVDLGALVSTSPAAWMYAAVIDIPRIVSQMQEPHLRVRLLVEVGRIGILALLTETGTHISEQVVSPTRSPITLNIELPRDRATTVIVRNTVDAVSRAVVLEASLCDRR